MANSIQNLRSYMFTWEWRETVITTPNKNSKVQVRIVLSSIRGEDIEVPIYNIPYYANNGKVTIENLADIYENYLIKYQTHEAVVTIRLIFDDNTAAAENYGVSIFYCHYKNTDDPAHFIAFSLVCTPHSVRIVPQNEDVHLSYIKKRDTDHFTLQCFMTFEDKDGYIEKDYCIDLDSRLLEDINYRLNIPYQFFKNKILEHRPTCKRIFSISIYIHATISGDSHMATIFYDDSQPYKKFHYRNSYNLLDTIFVPLTTTTKTKTEKSLASINHKIVPYNIKHSQTFVGTCPQLAYTQSLQLIEMLTSHYVEIKDGDGQQKEILIVDYKSEMSDERGAKNTIEFEWQYVEQQTLLAFEDEWRIHQKPYNLTYN